MSDAIRLEGISKQLGECEVLRDVSFIVKEGDVFGYLGPNGAERPPLLEFFLACSSPPQARLLSWARMSPEMRLDIQSLSSYEHQLREAELSAGL